MKLQIRKITDNYPYDLLLLADETIEGINRYLFHSDVYAATFPDDTEPVGVFCLLHIDTDTVEIMNIAVAENDQRRGLGSRLLAEAFAIAKKKRYSAVIAGTADVGVDQIRFYEKNGFAKYKVKENYFLDEYDEPIYKNGVQLKDRVMLRKQVNEPQIKYFENRKDWRTWLTDNFETAHEIWFVFPNKSSGKTSVLYNDAVEEALCFEWIDSTIKSLDREHKIQRFTPRNPKSTYSQANKERLKWLLENKLIYPKFEDKIRNVLSEPFIFPSDIIDKLKEDKAVWENYQQFSDSYKRIRIAYMEAARNRPEEFEKRLNHFISKTKENKKITGYGGIEKYY